MQKLSPKHFASRKGFTLAELLIVIVIMVALGAVTFLNYAGRSANTDLTATTQQIETLLREAQSRTLSGDQNGTSGNGFWGVSLTNSPGTAPSLFRLVYTTTTVASGTIVGSYPLPSSVAYSSSSIASGGTLYVYFSNGLTGSPPQAFSSCSGYSCLPSSPITIGLYLLHVKTGLSSTTISITSAGAVSD